MQSCGTRILPSYFFTRSLNPGMKIAGGGHTLNALEKLDLVDKFDHTSTGGGALISYLSGDPMPVLEALKESKKIFSGN